MINNTIEFKAEQLIEHLNDVSRETKAGKINRKRIIDFSFS